MKYEQYNNGMGMECYRYTYDYEQQYLPRKDLLIKYDTLEIENDTNNNMFGCFFTYYFYILKGKIVYSEIR